MPLLDHCRPPFFPQRQVESFLANWATRLADALTLLVPDEFQVEQACRRGIRPEIDVATYENVAAAVGYTMPVVFPDTFEVRIFSMMAGPAHLRIRGSADFDMVQFTANVVVVDDSDGYCIVVGFAGERNCEYQEALHFQRSHEFDVQDRELGMDQVYVERNDQLQGGYGGILRVELHANRVRLRVDDRMTAILGDSEFEIGLALSRAEFDNLRTGLQRVFRGFDSLVESAAEQPEH